MKPARRPGICFGTFLVAAEPAVVPPVFPISLLCVNYPGAAITLSGKDLLCHHAYLLATW
jgi:hypothetical protein